MKQPQMLPLITIAMPVYNAASTLRLAVKSILLQSYSNWELIIFDDGSTDETLRVAQSFDDHRIKVLFDGENMGLAARLNQIMDVCHGEYFARLDADDIAYPDRLQRQVMFLLRNRNIDLVASGAIVFKSGGVPVGLFPVRETHAQICKSPWSGFYLAHPTWMGRVEWFRQYRYRPDSIKAQDQDLLLRSYRVSTFACLPETLIGYRQETLSLKKIFTSRYYFSRSLIRMAVEREQYWVLLLVVGKQIAKASIDVFAILSRLDRFILRHRALPIDEREIYRWMEVWDSCNKGLEQKCVD